MEQTTSLSTKIYTSSLRWNIEHFLDYSDCCIEKLKSVEIRFKEFDAWWNLEIWPKHSESNGDVKVAFSLNDNGSDEHRVFRAEIKVDGDGHHLMSPANRHLVERRGFYAEPEEVKAPVWVLDYQPNIQVTYERENFMTQNSLMTFLNGGTLTIDVQVCIKTVEVKNELRKIRQ